MNTQNPQSQHCPGLPPQPLQIPWPSCRWSVGSCWALKRFWLSFTDSLASHVPLNDNHQEHSVRLDMLTFWGWKNKWREKTFRTIPLTSTPPHWLLKSKPWQSPVELSANSPRYKSKGRVESSTMHPASTPYKENGIYKHLGKMPQVSRQHLNFLSPTNRLKMQCNQLSTNSRKQQNKSIAYVWLFIKIPFRPVLGHRE